QPHAADEEAADRSGCDLQACRVPARGSGRLRLCQRPGFDRGGHRLSAQRLQPPDDVFVLVHCCVIERPARGDTASPEKQPIPSTICEAKCTHWGWEKRPSWRKRACSQWTTTR